MTARRSSPAQARVVFDRLAADYDVAGPGCFAWFGQWLVDGGSPIPTD